MTLITEEEKLLKGNRYFNIAWKVSFDALVYIAKTLKVTSL